ncbi:MAG: holo-ACP synthase [Candidatus Aureabacteria bacterium]|nr:holo-ACP synthase [Candidatus Auribacterota bacterium]
MIVGIGVDIVDVNRIKKIIQGENGNRFIERTFSETEIEYCNKFKDPFTHFAGRFAVKEGFYKAVNSIVSELALKDIETINTHSGEPKLKVKAKNFNMEKYNIKISISHTEGIAAAFVVVEAKEGV